MNVCVCVDAGLSANLMKLETRAEAAVAGVSHSETVDGLGLGWFGRQQQLAAGGNVVLVECCPAA